MKSKFAFCLALVLSGGWFVWMADAQPVFHTYNSLELRVAQAEAIFRGSVSSCKGVFIERQGGYFGGYREDGTKRPDGVMRYTITVKVDEVLKGKPARTFEVVQETSADDKRFDEWAEHRTQFLWFRGGGTWSNLRGVDSQTNTWNTIRLGEPVPAESIYSGDSPVFSMDFVAITNRQEILARVRNAVKSHSDSTQNHMFKTLWTTESAWEPFASLAVPVNGSLEKLARRMIQSPDMFVPKQTSWTPTNAEQRKLYDDSIVAGRNNVRAEGISALQYFKSKENIKVIEPFLNDSAFLDMYYPATGKTEREFFLRKAAFETLRKWNVEVPKPVVEEDITATATKP